MSDECSACGRHANAGPHGPGFCTPVPCSKCGSDDVIVYMEAATAVCPKCCDDHEYEYEPGECEHWCRHCGDPAPADWYYCDDDVPCFGTYEPRDPSEPIGTPASSMNGNAAQRHEDPAGWANWVAFCERNGHP